MTKHTIEKSSAKKDSKNGKKSKKTLWITIGIITGVVAIIGVIGAFTFNSALSPLLNPSPTPLYTQEQISAVLNSDDVYDNIFIDDIDMGGLSKADAQAALAEYNDKLLEDIQIQLNINGKRLVLTHEDFDITDNTSELLEQIYTIGRSGEENKDYEDVLDLKNNPLILTHNFEIDATKVKSKVDSFVTENTVTAVDAEVTEFDPTPTAESHFVISDHKQGIVPDGDKLWQDVLDMVDTGTFGSVKADVEIVEPLVTTDMMEQNTSLIVEFTTTMSNNSNRISNIKLCSSQINGTIILPGAGFSFNETTGYRSREMGYKNANVIVSGNELTEGLAGGICQVSGTLYNAMVRSDMEILERHHHSFELGYLKRGRDATLEYKGKDPWAYSTSEYDLKGKNNSEYPMYILMYTDGLKVISKIFGQPLEDGMTIDLDVKTTKTISPGETVYVADTEIEPGGEPEVFNARTGIKCTSYRVYYDKDGEEIEREKLYDDYYRPYAKEIHVHPDDMPGAETPSPSPTVEPTAGPTAEPTTAPTDAPTASPEPTSNTPVPTTPEPATPEPATPVPSTPEPATPVPATPVPATPEP